MSYTALYRKFRPDSFADVKGQDHIVTTLKNQLKAKRIGHAYLFTGTRGTGKTTMAKLFAKMVNCENPTEDAPCGQCGVCRAIAAGASMNVVEIDAASNNGVDNIREIIDEVSYSPTEGNYKVYIIDEVHMLSAGAFNALLKTLEEPPSYVIFILATTEVHKLPVTILSRCQRYDFKRISIDTIAARMDELTKAEGVEVEEKALRYIAKAADGSLRDGLSLLDQCIAFHMDKALTYADVLDVLGAVDTEVFSRLLRGIVLAEVLDCMNVLEDVVMQGRELSQFVTDFTWYLRNLMLVTTSDDLEDVIDMSSENLARLKEEAQVVSLAQIIRYIRVFSELSNQLRYAANKRILTEIALIKLCKPQMETDESALLERLRQVEEKLQQAFETGAFEAAPLAKEGPLDAAAPVAAAESEAFPVPLFEADQADAARLRQEWHAFLQQLSFIMRANLKHVVPDLDSQSGKLILVFSEDGTASDFFNKNASRRQELEQAIGRFLGKNIPVAYEANDAEEADGPEAKGGISGIDFEDIETEEE